MIVVTSVVDDKFSVSAEETKKMRGGLWAWLSETQTAATGASWTPTLEGGKVNVRPLVSTGSDTDAMIASIELAIARAAEGRRVEGGNAVEWEGFDLSQLRNTRARLINERTARDLAAIGVGAGATIREI